MRPRVGLELDAPKEGTIVKELRSIGRELRPSLVNGFAVLLVVGLFGPTSYALFDASEVKLFQILACLLVPFVLLLLFMFYRYPGWFRI